MEEYSKRTTLKLFGLKMLVLRAGARKTKLSIGSLETLGEVIGVKMET